jgi:hypothetical protein
MKIKNIPSNITNVLRSAGYHPDKIQKSREMSFSRPLLSDRYPRFHIYYSEERKEINLHLDHKAPKYESAPDHGAEYDGKMVEEEAERIKSFF